MTGAKRYALEGLIFGFSCGCRLSEEAEDIYGASEQFGSTLPVNLNFQCGSRTSARNYMFRLSTKLWAACRPKKSLMSTCQRKSATSRFRTRAGRSWPSW